MSNTQVRLLVAVAVGATASLLLLLFVGACVGSDPQTTPTPDIAVPDGASQPGPEAAPPPPADTGVPDAGGVDAADAAPKRFCQTQAPVTGVTDFFCADFDGTRIDEGFTQDVVPDGGAVTRATDIFFSSPNSVTTSGGATLVWQKVGATAFTEIDAQVRVNAGQLGGVVPLSTATATLLELQSIDTNVSINYTHGATVDGTANYIGYYMLTSSCPNACALLTKKIDTPLPLNEWTNLELVWTSAGLVTVSFNGVSVLNTAGFMSTSTKVTTTLGITAFGGPVGMGRHAFDNFVVSVRRK